MEKLKKDYFEMLGGILSTVEQLRNLFSEIQSFSGLLCKSLDYLFSPEIALS